MWEYRDSLGFDPSAYPGVEEDIASAIRERGYVIGTRGGVGGTVMEFVIQTEEGLDNLFDLAVNVAAVFGVLESYGLSMEIKRECVVDHLKSGAFVKPYFPTDLTRMNPGAVA